MEDKIEETKKRKNGTAEIERENKRWRREEKKKNMG